MADLQQLARVLSFRLVKLLEQKYPAFVPAQATQSAIDQGLKVEPYYNGNCDYLTSSDYIYVKYGVWCVSEYGKFYCGYYNDNLGLRVAFGHVYNPKSKIVKECKNVTKKIKVFNNKKYDTAIDIHSLYTGWYAGQDSDRRNDFIVVKSTAPIVTFGKKEYVWLNKEECESGQEKVMLCINTKIDRKAESYEENGGYKYFGNATNLHKQAENDVLEFATEEEKAKIVPMILFEYDRYESQKFLFPKNSRGSEPGLG